MCQTPNSPDLNAVDLGFFATLQSLLHKLFPGPTDDIVHKVHQAYEEYPAERSNRVFLSIVLHARDFEAQRKSTLQGAAHEEVGTTTSWCVPGEIIM